jgi:hypothetical protein
MSSRCVKKATNGQIPGKPKAEADRPGDPENQPHAALAAFSGARQRDEKKTNKGGPT